MTQEEKLELLRERFCHQSDRFAWQWWNNKDQRGGYAPSRTGKCLETPPCGEARCRHRAYQPITDYSLRRHLAGDDTIGIYQLGENNTVKWLAFDIDISDSACKRAGLTKKEAQPFVEECLRRLARVLKGWGIPFLAENSGNRGFHLWVFFSEPVPAKKVIAIGQWLIDQTSIPAGIGIELFPKQSSAPKFGNLVKMPMGVHRKSGKRCEFIGPTTQPLADQWKALRDVQLLSEEDVDDFIEEHELTVREFAPSTNDLITEAAVLPCHVKLMSTGAEHGMRDLAGFKLGCYLRSRGIPYEMAAAAMEAWNVKNDPPMADEDLRQKLDSAYSGSYSPFPCQETLFDSYCDPACRFYDSKMRQRGRKYGKKG